MAMDRGMQVCYGRCYEDLALPYLPFVEAMQAHVEWGPEDVGAPLGADAAVIGQFLHWAGMLPPNAGASTPAQSDQGKLQLFLAVSRATVTLARSCPTLVVVDDLHCRPLSLELFGHLVYTIADTAVRGRPLLILGTTGRWSQRPAWPACSPVSA